MKKGINYWAFPPKKDGSLLTPKEAFVYAKELGYDCFELTVEGSGPFSLDTTKKEAEAIRKSADEVGISLFTVASGLAWGCSPTHPDKAVRKQATSNSKKVIELAAAVGAETILYLPGMVSACFVPEFVPQPYDRVLGWATDSLKEILPTAERYKVRIGVENVWNRFLLSPLEMKDFIDQFKSEYVGSYFDVGNVMLYGHPEHWIEILGKRIFAVHMKDFRLNVGNLDGFVDLLSGDVNYSAVIQALKKVKYSGPCTAEIVPGKVGAAEKAIVSLKLIEQM